MIAFVVVAGIILWYVCNSMVTKQHEQRVADIYADHAPAMREKAKRDFIANEAEIAAMRERGEL